MTKNEVEKRLEEAALALVANQPDIYELTPETGQTEWNLQRHLANEVHKLFAGYECDTDIVKKQTDHRPDIVLHKRRTHEGNFLAIEVKRDKSEREIEVAKKRIYSEWFAEPFKYQFGAVINLRPDKTAEIQVFENKHR